MFLVDLMQPHFLLRIMSLKYIVKNHSSSVSRTQVSDYGCIPSLGALSEVPFCCLQEGEEPPTDHTDLFQGQLYALDNSLLPSVLRYARPYEGDALY